MNVERASKASFVGLALLAFACSVYDAPTDLGSGHAGQMNAAGDETAINVGGASAGKSSQGGAGTTSQGGPMPPMSDTTGHTYMGKLSLG